MFLIRIFHWFTGYICFTATGGFPERFINLCAGMHIPVWDIRPCGDKLHGRTKISCYIKLRRVARKSGMRLHLSGKKGLPFFLHRHKSHCGLAIGGILFLLITALLSSRIWVIRIENLQTVPEETIRASLKENGIQEGMRKKDLHASLSERNIVSGTPELSWIALNAEGSVLHVEVRETLQTQQAEDYEHPCHIVAGKDGFLRTVEPYEGAAMVQPQTAVEKGQLLISGITENQDGSVCLHHAKGYVEAETTLHHKVSLDCQKAFPTVTGQQKKIALTLFGHTFSPGFVRLDSKKDCFTYTRYLTAKDYRLPLSYTVSRTLSFGDARRLTAQESGLLCLSDLVCDTIRTLNRCTILSQNIQIERGQNKYIATGEYKLLENIGMEQKILLQEQGTDPEE